MFADRQEALKDLRWRFGLPDEPASNASIASAIERLLRPDRNGGLAVTEQPGAVALLHWRPS